MSLIVGILQIYRFGGRESFQVANERERRSATEGDGDLLSRHCCSRPFVFFHLFFNSFGVYICHLLKAHSTTIQAFPFQLSEQSLVDFSLFSPTCLSMSWNKQKMVKTFSIFVSPLPF